MNAYQEKKILDAIADCERFIAKESPRDPTIRPDDMKKHLDFCIKHKEKLIAMLAA
jgi:hypothetical protein